VSVSVAFEKARADGRAALVGYLPAGFPDLEGSIAALTTMVAAGCDVIEVGLPYSDPVMDGPVIQDAVQRSLDAGFRVDDVFRVVEAVAATGTPTLVMTSWNPVVRRGVDRFAQHLHDAGGAGLITPDVTPDVAEDWIAAADARDLDKVFLVAPSSTDERIAMTTASCRGFVYATGIMGVTGTTQATAAGVAPLIAYNVWAFGSVTHSSYKGAVAIQGDTGRDVIGLNDSGFFGIEVPDVQIALDLLFANKGLLTLAPVLALALAGVVLLYRRGLRAESYVIGGLFLAYLTYNSGYWLPFGGGSPGPRFLVPVLPFLALPLALAWRRWPATALALATVSAVLMATLTATLPLIGNDDIGYWMHIVDIESFEHTVASAVGLDNGWLAIAPFAVALLAAALLAVRATGPVATHGRERLAAAGIVLAWGALAVGLPEYRGRDLGPESHAVVPLIAVAAGAGLLALAVSTPLSRSGRAFRDRWLRQSRTRPAPSSGRSRP